MTVDEIPPAVNSLSVSRQTISGNYGSSHTCRYKYDRSGRGENVKLPVNSLRHLTNNVRLYGSSQLACPSFPAYPFWHSPKGLWGKNPPNAVYEIVRTLLEFLRTEQSNI